MMINELDRVKECFDVVEMMEKGKESIKNYEYMYCIDRRWYHRWCDWVFLDIIFGSNNVN